MAQLRKLLNARAGELTALRTQLADQTAEIEGLHAAQDLMTQQSAIKETIKNGAAVETDGLRREYEELQQEYDELKKQLADAESQVALGVVSEESTSKKEDLQERFEMAVEDVRELKRQNADLEAKLNKSRAAGKSAPAAAVGEGRLDWEAQKRRQHAGFA